MRNQLVDRDALRRAEIERIDALSRTRALTEPESRRLQSLIYLDSYAPIRRKRGRAA
nr:hypothetical protein [uncultured Sphingomonas sp.]